jgi:hypothetical protein
MRGKADARKTDARCEMRDAKQTDTRCEKKADKAEKAHKDKRLRAF